jgi:predicted RNA-binding protein with EMAP domain
MTYDTTKDPRIIVAHLACNLLKKSVKQKTAVPLQVPRDTLPQLVSVCESAVLTLMYMYQEPGALASAAPLSDLAGSVKTIADAYEKLLASRDDHSLLRATLRWCLRTLQGLPERLINAGTTLAAGIDLVVVQVRNVAQSGGFWKTIVNDGKTDYTVVTNLTGVKTNSKLAVAFLPPREIGGTVSEAMFLGSDLRTEAAGTVLDDQQADAREAAAILYDEVTKHPK